MVEYTKEDAFKYLGITQEQYDAIKSRWCDGDLISHDQPFVWSEDNPYFRAWNPNCINDSYCRNILENEIGISNLPDFSAYVKSSLPRYQTNELNFFEETLIPLYKGLLYAAWNVVTAVQKWWRK